MLVCRLDPFVANEEDYALSEMADRADDHIAFAQVRAKEVVGRVMRTTGEAIQKVWWRGFYVSHELSPIGRTLMICAGASCGCRRTNASRPHVYAAPLSRSWASNTASSGSPR